MPAVLPNTTGGHFANRRGFSRFTRSLGDAGAQTIGVIRCDQPRTLDLGARKGKHLESIMDDVLARLATIFEWTAW